MSAFEVVITPPRVRNALTEAHQPTMVYMAPFSAKAIVQFENVPLTKTAKRILRVINSSDEDIEVKVTKAVPPEHNLTIEWTEKLIPAQNEVEMELRWSPEIEIACKQTLQLTDNRNFRKDVMIILKSRCNKPAKQTKKFPTLSSSTSNATTHVRTTMRLKSPTNGIKHKRTFNNSQTQQRKQEKEKKTENTPSTSSSLSSKATAAARAAKAITTITKGTVTMTDKKRLPNIYVKGEKPEISITRPNGSQMNPLVESNTIARMSTNSGQSNFNISPSLNNSNSNEDIPKENISPFMTDNVMDIIDDIQFTPLTTNIGTERRFNFDTLANLPTPIDSSSTATSTATLGIRTSCTEVRLLRPRKLTSAELGSPEQLGTGIEIQTEGADVTANSSGIITNKTFEVKRTEDFNLSNDSLDGSGFGQPVMNRTTTVMCTPMGRTLTVIKEEEDSVSASETIANTSTIVKHNKAQNSDQEDLKRDIKLIGTPLRKYSESMKDLSYKSPSNKLPIQGSMPNLNELETIRSIEQNRYFHQSVLVPQNQEEPNMITPQANLLSSKKVLFNVKATPEEDINLSTVSITSQVELNFNQSEITSTSSRFNLNEIGGMSAGKARKRESPKGALGAIGKKSTNNQTTLPPKVSSFRRLSQNVKKDEQTKATATAKATAKPSHSGRKRSLHELSFSDTQSSETLAQTCGQNLRVSGKHGPAVSPPKRQRYENSSSDFNFVRPAPHRSPALRNDWSRTQPKNVAKLTKTLSLVKKSITPNRMKALAPRIKLYDTDSFLQTSINADPFAATTTCDPFLASTMYLDDRAVEMHQIQLRKFLNALVTMPEDLDADSNTKIDVGKLFNEVRNRDLTLAPTKEEQSMNYLTKYRLESLRRAAVELFFSEEMRTPCTQVAIYIKKHALQIRNDRNLHLDVVLQRNILELLLCFNPLWLRLGLEVVFGEKIHLHSNRDIVGLSTFILNRLFRDTLLEQKYPKAYSLSEEYGEHIKKFMLQKTLFLFLFLDKAKLKCIIKHNPCLFVKTSPYKETKDVLLRFSSQLLANIGNITRDLKRLGYVLQHKQTYLDEFDYAFANLAVDLRDGIRLTRIMEIILLRDNLTQQLRVPAISRLQRIYNVNLALRALKEADFHLSGNITAADIVDGHRERTLSLLWQVIYKFRSPKFHAAARTIQTWWRRNWLRVVIRRRLRQKELQRKVIAATKIQAIFRGFVVRRFVRAYKHERMQAAIVLQKYIRRYLVQKRLMEQNYAAKAIQRAYRAHLVGKQYRYDFLHLRQSVIFIQRIFRRRLLARKLLFLADEAKRQREQKRHAAAAYIQSYWHAFCETRLLRTQYVVIRQYAICVQQRFRATRAMKQDRLAYLRLRQVTIIVQRKFRAKLQMRMQRQSYLETRGVIMKLQERRRALLQMRTVRAAYVQQREVIIKLQQRVRASIAMRQQRQLYQLQRSSACIIQHAYREHVAMKTQLECYHRIRKSIITIQIKWRATLLARQVRYNFLALQYYTVIVQQKLRARKLMHTERTNYLQLRAAAIVVQRHYRANRLMLKERTEYQMKMQSVIVLQRRLRAYYQMRFQRAKYQGTRTAVLCLQQYFRSYLLMKHQRDNYLRLKTASICIQRTWRAHYAMRLDRERFEKLRSSAILIQCRFKNKLQMRSQMLIYNNQRRLIIAMQRRWRAKLLARKIRQDYQKQLIAIVNCQRRYRALQVMRSQRDDYLQTIAKVIRIQRFYRSFKLMKLERERYLQKQVAAITIQRWYRYTKLMHATKENYELLRSSALIIQQKWRATLVARQQRRQYLNIRMKIQFIQSKFRSILAMRTLRDEFIQKRYAAIVLQRRYRSRLEMLKIRSQYQLLVTLVVCLQRKFRARREMIKQHREYHKLRCYTIHLQQKFRGKRLVKTERANFILLRRSVIVFQAHARGVLARHRFQALLTPEMQELKSQKRAARIIQRFYRGYLVRKRWRSAALLQIRQNIIASKTAASALNTLRYKICDSVRVLRGRYCVSDVMNVLQRLERVSRMVPHLVGSQSEFISTFCYGMMAQAIRSEIDKQMIELCSRIILNLARYNGIECASFQENGLVTIAQMLLRWCDKDCEIFNTLCTLVWIFAHCPKKCEIIRAFMTTNDAIYMLRETKKLVARKEKMKQNDRRLISIGPQQKAFSKKALPSLDPDYGIITKKPYIFISSVYAFDTLLLKLGIDVF